MRRLRHLRLLVLCAVVVPSAPLAAAPARHAAARPMTVPFIADDFDRAISEARATHRPLLVDAGAPWCHTCRSMDAYVFTDAALAPQKDRYVWLKIDTEKAVNAAFLKRYPIPALPTYLILDPTDGRVALRWVGGATVPQLLKILDDGRAAVLAPAANAAEADRMLASAETLYGAEQDSAAAVAYEAALAKAPATWPKYTHTVESLLFALTQAGENLKAAELARDALPRVRHSTSAGNVVGTGLEAALAIDGGAPGRAALVQGLERDAREIAADRSVAMAADDRSGVYIALLDARQDVKDSTGAHQVAADWAAFLEGEAARAATPDARAVFDPHRLSAYLELGEPERALPMLEASERDLPDDYNPPARLAIAYRAMHRWRDGLAASDRALAKAYGPRTLLMLQVRTDLYLGLGDSTSARRTLDDAVKAAEGFPEGQRSDRTIAALKKRRAALN